MKVITTNLLNRFYKNGVKPIKDALAKKLDTTKVVSNLTTTAAGYALDARQGKALNDKIVEINGGLGSNYMKFANGLLIQWGASIHGAYANVTSDVNLPIPYMDKTYRIFVTPGRNCLSCTGYWIGSQEGNNTRTEKKFQISATYSNKTYEKDWEWMTVGRWK